MKAVILVGGEATRLRPLTCNRPKAMVPVLNTPLLEHIISHLKKHGVSHFILAQDTVSPQIEGYFGDGRQLGINISYVLEKMPLGTAGAIKNTESHLAETFLALNGDIFTDLDITAMLAYHDAKKALVTIALTPVEDPTSYGLVETDDSGRITRFREKPKPDEVTTNLINAGIYIIATDVLKVIPPRTNCSIEREIFPALLEDGKPLYAYPTNTYWIDVGTPEKYLKLNFDLLNKNGTVQIGEGCQVHPTTRIAGPAVIGNNSIIAKNVTITGPAAIGAASTVREDAEIRESVIWDNVIIGRSTKVKGSIIAHNCCLGSGSTVKECVIGDNVTLTPGVKLEPQRKIWPGETI